MAFELTIDHLPDLSLGAALLGTGGGGDPHAGRLLAAQAIRTNGNITVLDLDDLADDDFVVPTAMIGAPSVLVERIPAGNEPVDALRALERLLGRTATATMPIESGGINSMIPLFVAGTVGLPVVDGDGMGRAFPELQMETFGIYGCPGSPLAIADERGYSAIVDTGQDNKKMEKYARALAISMGGVGYVADYPMSGADVKRTAIPRTLSLALRLGRTLREAREQHRDPVEALSETLSETLYERSGVVFEGKVIDVLRKTDGGFTKGSAKLVSFDGGSTCQIDFQNEFLLARVDDRPAIVVPDLITVLHAETGEPITAERLRYGHRVRVFAIGTPEIMRTPEALDTFGPRAFGIDLDFVPFEQLAASKIGSSV
ncbi:DUF917 domain-containing protein [Amycolatopsis sacchari]|uniref:DUF917 domain-containing protein n=1 Tax=Amycolatopsis sacchari TaxID=115433 RepID=UPI003D74C32E